MNTCRPAVEIEHLRKTYGTLVAVDDVSVSVAEGEIFGILGPNGAGKTTAIECAIGLRQPDAGTIRLLGLDPRADRAGIHQMVGVQLQASAFPAKLRVGEILDMYRSFYRHPADVSELTGALGLAGKRDDYYRSLSGGQRQRLSVALALIGRPRLAFLDEMTTGLDPQARRDAWALRFVSSAPFDETLLTGLPEVAGVIGRLVLIPMLFFAGLWWPRELMPAVLRDVSDVVPLGAAVEAIQDSMRGPLPPAAPLLVLTGWAVLFGFLAMRFFRWE